MKHPQNELLFQLSRECSPNAKLAVRLISNFRNEGRIFRVVSKEILTKFVYKHDLLGRTYSENNAALNTNLGPERLKGGEGK